MCGIAGIVGTSGVNQRIYDALTVLQHRGQDAAGIATVQDGELLGAGRMVSGTRSNAPSTSGVNDWPERSSPYVAL